MFVAAAGAGSVSASAAAAMFTKAAVIGGAVGGFAGGLIASGGDFSAALIGSITGGAAGYIGTSGWQRPTKAFAHGVVGGTTSKLQGGKFSHGFMSSAFSKMVSGKVHKLVDKNAVLGGVTMAMIGGTASALGGGKFSNGARTAAIQYLFNETQEVLARVAKDFTRMVGQFFEQEGPNTRSYMGALAVEVGKSAMENVKISAGGEASYGIGISAQAETNLNGDLEIELSDSKGLMFKSTAPSVSGEFYSTGKIEGFFQSFEGCAGIACFKLETNYEDFSLSSGLHPGAGGFSLKSGYKM
tara:strand:+ start:30805 stop:31701 length:897 start_codon:yes stop_codon:yes gene_type:complete